MGQFTVVSLGLLAMFLSLSGAKGDNCPASWISRNGVCNKLFPDRKTWLEAEKRTWKWSDRTSANYFSWNQGEPNDVQDNENCVHLWAPSGYLKWNDEPCASLHPFICQYKL
uniref:C-type lectin lectoxin-Enh1 n=1 Tax=Pseudoferania polylepis TaxID=338839 RepID=LECM1_PSEPL|nr:RecName: Full=C-type lectin lectoxin-Enh1; Short=CTL; Flags: Precursor [Pseudoferania polylepis]ABU68489.1 Lectoxin-Enh1 [Pseudoferania polylepis]